MTVTHWLLIYLMIGLALAARAWHIRLEEKLKEMARAPEYEMLGPAVLAVSVLLALSLFVLTWPVLTVMNIFLRKDAP